MLVAMRDDAEFEERLTALSPYHGLPRKSSDKHLAVRLDPFLSIRNKFMACNVE